MEQNASYEAITKEFQKCQQDNDFLQIGWTFKLKDNNIYQWKVTINGPKDTPYENGIFTILISFPPDYPLHGPEFKFLNKVYLINVDNTGQIIHLNLNQWAWVGKVKDYPDYDIKHALLDIYSMFYYQALESPINWHLAIQYRDNKPEFDKEAKKWTQEYATKPL